MNSTMNINKISKAVVIAWAVLCVTLLLYVLSVVRTYEHAMTVPATTVPAVQTEVLQWSDTAKWGGGWNAN